MSMAMEMNGNDVDGLLIRYFSGETTPEETERLGRMVDSDPALKKQFEEYRRTWDLLAEARIAETTDIDREWDRFRESAAGKEAASPAVRSFPFRSLLRVAALLVLLLVPAWLVWNSLSEPRRITLTASSGPTDCILPDGSVITLRQGATIAYPASFSKKERLVEITGQACFDVKPDPERPFIVSAGKVRVEVLGTVFYVFTGSAEEPASVVLSSGSVTAYLAGDKKNGVLLTPGEEAVISETERSISKHPLDDPNRLAWKTRRMVFENAPLGNIVLLLNEVYTANIRLSDPGLARCRITATFDRQSLESVLHVLEATLGLTAGSDAGGMILTGPPCE